MLEAIFLGIVQGITEFLPISSSAHLILLTDLIGKRSDNEDNLLFDLLLHIGTLAATVIIFREPIKEMIFGKSQKALTEDYENDEDTEGDKPKIKEHTGVQNLLLIITACVPTAIIAFPFKDFFEKFNSPSQVSMQLMITGCFLFATVFFNRDEEDSVALGFRHAFIIGLMQGLAVVPGISRSGITIATALFLGVSRTRSGEFSFLVSLPVLGGSIILKIKDIIDAGRLEMLDLNMAVGVFSAFLTGLIALNLLLHFILHGRIHYFAWYLWVIGGLGILFL